MKNKILNKILVVLLLTILAVPGVAYGEEDYTIMPISIEYTHWADKYIDTLYLEYNTEEFFENKDLDDEISAEDLVFLIQNTLKDDFEYNQEEITREKAVYEFTKIWAEKTEQNLDEIATIKMIIYADTEKIGAEYNHAVTVAYMKGIAEGRGERIFDPKALLTYGEAAALVVKTEEAVEEEMKNQNPIVEGKFETRGDYEVTNDMVTFNFELFSHYEESKELMFSSGQQFEITVTNEKEEEVYKFSDGKVFTMALIYETVEPGEAITWSDEWDRTDKEGNYLESGKYKAKIEIFASPSPGPVEEEKVETEDIPKEQLTKTIEFTLYELDEEGKITSESAKSIIKDKATKVMEALKVKDIESLIEYVHPEKGLRFTPYTTVDTVKDVVFSIEELKNFNAEDELVWGTYDGKGDDIILTPGEYYEEFVYTKDFLSADQIGYNKVLSSGNMIENQFEVYKNPIIVEYYIPGEEFENAWQSLRLVFEEYEGDWKLVGIIHNEWTI